MKRNKIKILFKPEDFQGNEFNDVHDCAISRAIKRELNPESVLVGGFTVDVYIDDKCTSYNIDPILISDDFKRMKKSYENDPLMEKEKFYVTLTNYIL